MAAKDTKGTRMGQITDEVMQEDLSMEKAVLVIYFKDDQFNIHLPEHMHGVLVGWSEAGFNSHVTSKGVLRAPTMPGIKNAWKLAEARYRHVIQHAEKKKVIVLNLQYNARGLDGGGHFNKHKLQSIGCPALYIDYQLAWEVNGKLYHYFGKGSDQQDSRQTLQRLDAGIYDAAIIEWSAEREQFFEGMRGALNGLIKRLHELRTAIDTGDIGGALLQFAQSGPALTGPKEAE